METVKGLKHANSRKWNGLLIEAVPVHYSELKSKNWKAFVINVGLSTVPYPTKVSC